MAAALVAIGQPGAKFLGRRHQPARPDEGRGRDAAAPRRRHPPAARPDRATQNGGLRIGAMVSNTDARRRPPRARALSAAVAARVLNGASAQLRNKATTGGNLLQRTRCYYFYDTVDALQQARAGQRLLGAARATTASTPSWAPATPASPCIPSDMAVALAALDAEVEVQAPHGPRAASRSPSSTACPGDTPQNDTNLGAGRADHRGDPAAAAGGRAGLPQGARPRVVRLRAGVGRRRGRHWTATIRSARIALGGVAHKPWRALEAERQLAGAPAVRRRLRRGRRGGA